MTDNSANYVYCAATTIKGQPCRGIASLGTPFCSSHLRRRQTETTTLNGEVGDQIIGSLTMGLPIGVALLAAGVPARSFYNWMDIARDSTSLRDQGYRDFRTRVESAKAKGERNLLLSVVRGAQNDPDLALRLLERMAPERWARVTQRAIAEPELPTVETVDPDDPLGEVLQLAAERRKRRAG